jgi:hypothetical protein
MKTAVWHNIRRKIKPKFQKAGITRCELGYPGCWYDNALGFAHARKRRNLEPDQGETVILACTACHQIIERMPEPAMERIVLQTIKARRKQPL